MLYRDLAKVYEKLESTSKQLEKIDILVELFKKTPTDIIDKVIFLTQGKLYPGWLGLPVVGIAEKSAIKAVSLAIGLKSNITEEKVREIGDLGSAFEKLHKKKTQTTLFQSSINVDTVYNRLDKIAQSAGPGSADFKVKNLAGLLGNVDAIDGKWILRTVLGKLRFGVADALILDSLTIAFTGDKNNKQIIERGYNIHPNLGEIAKILASDGLDAFNNMQIEIFIPLRMMLAQRSSSIDEILEKLGGKCACEFKYDGERLQIHRLEDKVILYTRNLENATPQYPDVCNLIRTLKPVKFIIEGEVVGINGDTGEMLPFQELMHRRRKYKIEEAIEKNPICLFLFDILKKDMQDFLDAPYTVRRRNLQELVEETDQLKLATALISDNAAEIETFFNRSIESGCEGIIAKSLTSVYESGHREWRWIKLKESYQSKMSDTIDAVVVGAYYGRGRRANIYGAFLCGVLDQTEGTYKTICKLGSGFTDADLKFLIQKFEEVKRDKKHPQVTSEIMSDDWFEPKFIVEILADEITLSNVHTAGFGEVRPNYGFALRFPRFIRWREDKSIEDITTTDEIIDMYKRQIKTG